MYHRIHCLGRRPHRKSGRRALSSPVVGALTWLAARAAPVQLPARLTMSVARGDLLLVAVAARALFAVRFSTPERARRPQVL
jgi:hypothetical protein